MTNFTYTALDKSQSYTRGSIEARTSRTALSRLEKKGFLVVNLKRENLTILDKLREISTITRLDKILFTRHLHTLIESGIALDQAIKISAEQSTNLKLKSILLNVHETITKGQSLHSALLQYKKYFTYFFINLIKVGEKSGTLDESLYHLLEQQENDYELIGKARGALIYPVIVMIAAVLIVILMMVFVIPSISGILAEYGVDLPWTTKILIFLSNSFVNYGVYIAIAAILLLILFRILTKTPKGQWYLEELLLKIPLINTIIIEFNLARLFRAMYALLKSGVSINEALELSASVCSNSHYQKSFRSSIMFVNSGIAFTEVLKGHLKLYPAISTRMLEVGEKTGKVDHMFERLAAHYEKSVSRVLSNLSTIIEPVLLLFIGLVVAFVAVSILTPIWKFADTI